MKVTVPLGTQEGNLKCSAVPAPTTRALPGRMHVANQRHTKLRQSSLTALILVIPSSIDTLSDAFGYISNSFDFRPSGGGRGGDRGGATGQAGTAASSLALSGGGYSNLVGSLSTYINANTITIAVVAAVSASVANVVAASSVSNTASLANAFQMVGHAQCKPVCPPHSLAPTKTQLYLDWTALYLEYPPVCFDHSACDIFNQGPVHYCVLLSIL
jgi:hypothetical protein